MSTEPVSCDGASWDAGERLLERLFRVSGISPPGERKVSGEINSRDMEHPPRLRRSALSRFVQVTHVVAAAQMLPSKVISLIGKNIAASPSAA